MGVKKCCFAASVGLWISLSPYTAPAQVTVLVGSSLPADQGWSVSTNQALPDVSSDGTTITVNTIGTPEGGSARLYYYKDVGLIGGYFWVEFRLKLNALSAGHQSLDAGLAVFGIIDPATPGGTLLDRSDMVYFDTTEIGWGDDLDDYVTNTGSGFRTYRVAFDQNLSRFQAFVDGNESLIHNSTPALPTGVIAFGDISTAANLNSTFQIEWIRVFRDCNRNSIEDSVDVTNGAPDCDLDAVLDECEIAGNDCNQNSVLDNCDLLTGSTDCDNSNILDECEVASFDCNSNATLDSCDIQGGFSLDSNGDGFPDECSMEVVPNPVASDPTGIEKARFISFDPMPPQGDWATSALRVRLLSLHHVDPPYSGGPSVPFSTFEGQSVWAGPPTSYVESTSIPIPFIASRTQCTPEYRDWSTVGLIHLTGTQIVPSSVYHVENVSRFCQGIEDSCTLVSPPLEVRTARWCDVVEPFNPPSQSNQPDIGDIGALIDKFRSFPGAPIKARSFLAGETGNPWGEITHDLLRIDSGFQHLSAAVDAFRGKPYPYKLGKCAGNSAACTANSDCGANLPCELYCPD